MHTRDKAANFSDSTFAKQAGNLLRKLTSAKTALSSKRFAHVTKSNQGLV
jgi:hypothetical protein